MLLYATRNFVLQYNLRVLNLNDPVPIPDETQVDLAYIDVPLAINYHFMQKKRLNLSVAAGGFASFLIQESEQTTFINNESKEKTDAFGNASNTQLFGGILGLQFTYKIVSPHGIKSDAQLSILFQ